MKDVVPSSNVSIDEAAGYPKPVWGKGEEPNPKPEPKPMTEEEIRQIQKTYDRQIQEAYDSQPIIVIHDRLGAD
jgi:hypothetical protein